MASPISGLNGSASDALTDKRTTSIATKDMFLKLMVTQLRNQNPLNPQDGVQFITQLAQFTSLEQTMDIRSAVAAIRDKIAPEAVPPTTDQKGN